jgi:hypothetical protein
VIYLAGSLAVLGFVVALERLGVPGVAVEAIRTSRAAVGIVRNGSLTDDEKERSTRAAAVTLVKGFVSIGLRTLVAAGLFLVILLAFDLPGAASLGSVTEWLATLQGIVAMSALVILWILVRRRR